MEVVSLHTRTVATDEHAVVCRTSAAYGLAVIGGRLAVDVHTGIVLCVLGGVVLTHWLLRFLGDT
jgi:hypothetical protein